MDSEAGEEGKEGDDVDEESNRWAGFKILFNIFFKMSISPWSLFPVCTDLLFCELSIRIHIYIYIYPSIMSYYIILL